MTQPRDIARLMQAVDERIRVNSVLPWVVLDAADEWRSEEIPLSRAATHEAVARVVSFLCSDFGSYLTGVNLPVDGC